MNKSGGVPKRAAKGLSGVIMDTAKQAVKEPVNIAKEAAGQLGVGPNLQGAAGGADKGREQNLTQAKVKDRQEIGRITRQLGQMGQGSRQPVQPQASSEVGLGSSLQPGRVAKLDEEVKQAREKKAKKYDEIEEEFLRRVEADRKKVEEEVEADAAEIIPRGRKKRGLPPGVAGRQGTRETKFKQGK